MAQGLCLTPPLLVTDPCVFKVISAQNTAQVGQRERVLELDLVGYSDKARELQEHLGVDLVMPARFDAGA